MFDEQHTRRRVLAGTGTLAAGTIGAVALSSQETSATVNGEFTIPDAKTVTADTTVQDVRLLADVTWSYTANAPMNAVEVELHVGASPDTLDLIARTEQTDLGKEQLSGEEELSGSLISAADFSADDFNPSNGEVSTSVVAELRLFVLRDGSVEAERSTRTVFSVTVRDEELTVDSTLSGSGEVDFTTGSG